MSSSSIPACRGAGAATHHRRARSSCWRFRDVSPLTRRSFVHLPAAGLVTLLPSAWPPARSRPAPCGRLVPAPGSGAGQGSGRARRTATSPASANWSSTSRRWPARPSIGDSGTGRRRSAPRRTPAAARSPSCCSPTARSRRCSRRPCSAISTSCGRSSASPGIQRTLGPHGITLLAHARTGGADAAAVLKYLEAVGGADVRTTTQPLAPADRDAVVGRYAVRPGRARPLRGRRASATSWASTARAPTAGSCNHTGDLVFFPSGVPTREDCLRPRGRQGRPPDGGGPAVLVTATPGRLRQGRGRARHRRARRNRCAVEVGGAV